MNKIPKDFVFKQVINSLGWGNKRHYKRTW